MIVYATPMRAGGKWSAQLGWLRELWQKGESTMMVSQNVSLLKSAHLTKRAADGGYWFAKFVNNQMNSGVR